MTDLSDVRPGLCVRRRGFDEVRTVTEVVCECVVTTDGAVYHADALEAMAVGRQWEAIDVDFKAWLDGRVDLGRR